MADAASPASTSSPATESSLWSALASILSFIGTGVSALGFVVFFGGFIVWSRFHAAGLPADEAVAQIPRNDLIVTGAGFLIPVLVAALAGSAVAFVAWDALVGKSQRRHRVKAEAELEHLEIDVGRLRAQAERLKSEKDDVYRTLAPAQAILSDADSTHNDRERALDAYRQSDYDRLRNAVKQLNETQIPAAESAVVDAKARLDRPAEPGRRNLVLACGIGGLPLIAIGGAILILGGKGLTCWQIVVLVAQMLVTLAVAVAVISATGRFGLYVLSVVLGIALLFAVSTYARTLNNTKVSAIAALQGSSPVTGFFVAETGDAIYFAAPKFKGPTGGALDPNGATLRRVDKSELTRLTIGPLMNQSNAYRRSIELATRLCQLAARPGSAAAVSAPKAKKASSKRSLSGKPKASVPGCSKAAYTRLTTAQARFKE